ncbi:TolC family protein [Roseateles asaccharophilus]|uniref:Outer membrane protein TolC n=1 Tax=Roseateles asaccharophilus TaxID=582607 RepID=A0ABU2AAN5_9BURK|nr:TolC family protein [Roseateles asaccharophilus]MDR7334267.1 outer membrane protein TolC [Roseateles asaccharophilus]
MKRTLHLTALALALTGCASLTPGDEVTDVSRLTQPHTGQTLALEPLPADTLAARLREPLTADAAVQLALQNSRALQARLARLGVTAAEVDAASRLPNPGFSFSRLTRGDEVELERGWHFNLARLLTLPLVRQAEQRRLQAEQQQAAADVLALAADARRAWVSAVAAEETLTYRRQVLEAADAGAELARRMQAVGNFNALARAREQGFAAEARLALARAENQRLATRERLVRLLGLWGADAAALRLPERLPALPAAAREQPDIETLALAQRLDVQAARLRLEQAGRQLDAGHINRFVSMLELGVAHNSSNEAPVQRGWEVTLELPLFGPGPLPRAQALAREAAHDAADTAIRARSEVREAYGLYRGAWDIARQHRDELLPLAQRISDEQLLRYNGMLIGVFELLADARAQVAAVAAAQDALRDFWLAQADLDQALLGRASPTLPQAGAAPAAAAAAPH